MLVTKSIIIMLTFLTMGLSISITDNVPIISQHVSQVNKENILSENNYQIAQHFGNQITQVANSEQIANMIKEIIELTDVSTAPVKSLKYKFEVGYGTSGLKILEVQVKFENGQYDIKTTYLDVSVNVPQQYNKEHQCRRTYVKLLGVKLWRESDCNYIDVPRGLTSEEMKQMKTHLENKLVDHMYLFKEEIKSNVTIEIQS